MKADNTSSIVVLIDPLGPRKLSLLRKKREERMKELAERRICNKSVTDMLIANETLHKTSPKKVKEKAVIPPVQNKNKSVILDSCKVVKDPGSAKSNHTDKSSVNLDDSIQLRNGHVASPVPLTRSSEHRHSVKSTSVASKNKPAEQINSSEDTSVTTRMATRLSPQKSPLSQNSVANSQSVVTNNSSKVAMQSKSAGNSPVNHGQPKCLQPSKCTRENVKNTVSTKVQSGVKVKDLENIYSSVVQFSKGQLSQRINHKPKNSKAESNTALHSDTVRSTKKPHCTKSLSTRISLRLRRLRQKTQKVRGHGENKVAKPGVKRKLDSTHSSTAPASKKLKQS